MLRVLCLPENAIDLIDSFCSRLICCTDTAHILAQDLAEGFGDVLLETNKRLKTLVGFQGSQGRFAQGSEEGVVRAAGRSICPSPALLLL